MSDNYLAAVDSHRSLTGDEPHTIEGALLRGMPPLRDMSSHDARLHFRMLRLAREYMVDFDLPRASARAGVPWDLARGAERDAVFILMLRGLTEEMRPEEVVTRGEVLNMLKREACTAAKASDRIAALNHLARITGMEPQQDDRRGGAPVINITLNGGPAERPAINVTTSGPEALL